MPAKTIESNQAAIRGKMVSPLVFSHESYGTRIYKTYVSCRRYSGAVDTIPVLIPDGLVDVSKDYTGAFIKVNGVYTSHNRHDGKKSYLILSLFAKDIEWIGEELDAAKTNNILLDGYLCKEPVYRMTPLGRKITDILLAVNRDYGKTDYIPSVFWGKDAEASAGWGIGKHIKVTGRIQSRKYIKQITGTESEERVAYEVSVKGYEIFTDAARKS